MDYLKQLLGIQVRYIRAASHPVLPGYLSSRYTMKKAKLEGIDAVFVHVSDELEPTDVLKKHLGQIEVIFGAKAVLVLDRMTYRQREYLLRSRIPFVVEGKQVFLPFLAIYLQNRCDGELPEAETLTPAAQVLLLHYIYSGCGEMKTSDAARTLSFTPMSISRASKQLERIGLLETKRIGVEKMMFCTKSPRELFKEAGSYWLNPVKRTVYLSKKEVGGELLFSGESALCTLSALNHPRIVCYASGNVSSLGKSASPTLLDGNEQCAVELWRYDPKRLSTGDTVDPLSLALAFREGADERIEGAVDEILERTWKEIDGKGN